jgi:hypothetical protein
MTPAARITPYILDTFTFFPSCSVKQQWPKNGAGH